MTATTSPGPRPGLASLDRAARTSAVAALVGIGALHAAWGAGSSWPMANRADLSDAVLGSQGLQRGGAASCYAVAGALGTAAALVAGWPKHGDRPRRVAVAAIAAILASRGALGLTGRTRLVSPVSTGERFRRLDRQIYAPLCLTLAGLTALSLHYRIVDPRTGDTVEEGERTPGSPIGDEHGRARIVIFHDAAPADPPRPAGTPGSADIPRSADLGVGR